MHNRPQEDVTPISSASPVSNTTSSPTFNMKNTALLTYSGYAGVQTYRTVMGELKEQGNERFVTSVENIVNAGSRLAMIVGTKGIAAIPMAIEGLSSQYQMNKERERENIETRMENTLRGKRNRLGGGLGG
jgi:hypothetical protein